MATHSNVSTTVETPHSTNTTSEIDNNSTLTGVAEPNSDKTTNAAVETGPQQTKKPNSRAIKRRAQAILNDMSIDAQSRGFIRYVFEIDDPYLADLVRRVDAGENLAESFDFSRS